MAGIHGGADVLSPNASFLRHPNDDALGKAGLYQQPRRAFFCLPPQGSDIRTYQTSFLILFALQSGRPHSQAQAFVYIFLSVQSDEGNSIQEIDSPFSLVGMRLAQSVIDG